MSQRTRPTVKPKVKTVGAKKPSVKKNATRKAPATPQFVPGKRKDQIKASSANCQSSKKQRQGMGIYGTGIPTKKFNAMSGSEQASFKRQAPALAKQRFDKFSSIRKKK